MVLLLTISAIVMSFLMTLAVTPYWIRRARRAGFISKDKHKPGVRVADIGGLAVVSATVLALLYYIGLKVFVYQNNESEIMLLLVALSSLLIAALIGLVDDLLGWKVGLRRLHRLLLSFFIALPVMVINAGVSVMSLPFIGRTELGLLYPLLVVPVAVVGSANAFNMIGGYNGLEAGLGCIILTTLGALSYMAGRPWVALMALIMAASLFGFLFYNWYPARVFPGNTLSYAVGAMIAITAILGNIEKFALFVFLLFFAQFVLKARGRMQRESFAAVSARGSLLPPYKRFYAVEHIAVHVLSRFRKDVREQHAVLLLLSVQGLISGLTVLYFLRGSLLAFLP